MTVLSERMRIDDWSRGGMASSVLSTARHTRMLMCRCLSCGDQRPEAQRNRKKTRLPPPEFRNGMCRSKL